jgi:hypothetical protein
MQKIYSDEHACQMSILQAIDTIKLHNLLSFSIKKLKYII